MANGERTMITSIATVWFVVICYTSTIASCVVFNNLVDATDCTAVYNKIVAKRITARIELCDSHRTLIVNLTSPSCGDAGPLCAK